MSPSPLASQLTVVNSLSPTLSTRGTRALGRPPLLKCALFENQFCLRTNENGVINLGVAENSLMTEWLQKYYSQKQFQLEYQDFTYGSALGGSVRLFAALENLTTEYFNSRIPVRREHVIAGSGCGSVIDLLVSCIADEGDGILVGRPFYNGFGAAFSCRNDVVPVGVDLPCGEEGSIEAIAHFETALARSNASGVKIKAVMLCNPHNPLGFCYSKPVLLAYAAFAEKHNLHLIVDEIYALSTFVCPDLPDVQEFVSILSLDVFADARCNASRIHSIYGASKDFSSNGLRLGALISQFNPDLHTAMESSCLLMKISSAADLLWSSLLLDTEALPAFITSNRQRLSAAYERATAFLGTHGIPYRPSNAGHFIFVDLRKFLPVGDGKTDVEKEEELADRFMKRGLVLARGTAYQNPVAGWFRLTFTLRPDYFEAGISRLEECLKLDRTVSVDVVCHQCFKTHKVDELVEETKSVSLGR